MSFKSGYFCGFCQKEGCLSYNLQNCERCEIAIYCEDKGPNAKKCKDQAKLNIPSTIRTLINLVLLLFLGRLGRQGSTKNYTTF